MSIAVFFLSFCKNSKLVLFVVILFLYYNEYILYIYDVFNRIHGGFTFYVEFERSAFIEKTKVGIILVVNQVSMRYP